VEEEMRRSIEFCKWKVSWWKQQCHLRASHVPPWVAEGILAYATEQADVEFQRASKWTLHWAKIRQHAATVLEKLGGDEGTLPDVDIIINDDEDESDIDSS
jgi:hypothetical protein